MSHCPKCHVEVAADARFCPECGTAIPADQPQSSAGKTVVLPAIAPTTRLPENAAASVPTTRLSEEPDAPTPPAPGSVGGDAKTIIAGLPAAPADPPASLGANVPAPTAAYPAPQPGGWSQPGPSPSGGQIYATPARSPLDGVPSQPASGSGSGRLWLIIGLVAGLGILTIIVLIAGLAFLGRNIRPTPTQVSLRTSQPVSGAASTAVGAGASEPTAVADAFDATLLKDSFDNPKTSSLSDGETDEANFAFKDGTYTINLQKEKYIVWSTFKGTYDDAALEVDAAVDGPPESAIGLMFRYQNDKNFYMFLVSGDGRYGLDMYVDDKLTTLIDWTESPEINASGEMNHLRVETEGHTIRLFVNDKLLDEISDDTFKDGEMALAINTFDKGDATATFDNLIVRGKK